MKINTALILCAGFGKRLNPITLDTPKPLIKLMHLSSILTSLISNRGFGVFKVIGFNLLPKPAHKIKAVFILTTLPYKFWKIIF